MSYRSVFWKTTAFSLIATQQSLFCYYDQDVDSNTESYLGSTPFYEEDEVSDDNDSDAPTYHRSSSFAYQQEPYPQNDNGQPTPLELNSRLQIGGNYTYVNFKPKGNHSFRGNLGGAQAIYEYRPMNQFYGAGRFAWHQGTMHGHSEKRTLTNYEGQERLGYTFANDDWDLSLYTGFGYHYLKQRLSPKSGDSLKFTYNEFYVPVGWLANYCVNSWFEIGIDFTWMPQVFSSVTIVPLGGARWSLKNTLTNFYVSLPHTFTFTKSRRFQIILNPFYEHWEDGHSTAKLSSGIALGLPKNMYNYYGVDVNFAYRF